MASKDQRLEDKAEELRVLLGDDPLPIMGVQVKRFVRVRRGRLVEVRQRVILDKPPLGGGAVSK